MTGPLDSPQACNHAQRKQEAVLRLLRCEDMDPVNREMGVPAADLDGWRDRFRAAGS